MIRECFALLLTLFLTGCGVSTGLGTIPSEALETDATMAPVTKTEQMLRALPAPRSPVAVAVYEFVDYTGQNKPADTPQYSRAVTQGGLAILKKALLDAGDHHWFRVVERGGINNLLNERKIIRSMRTEYVTADGRRLPPLAPLTYAGVILEGGITSYESNVTTGGLGARYLGIGGSTNYSRDMVTVYLRAVSVTTGEVLLSVSTSKTVYSIGLSGGLFKFVAYDKIAESETGVTYNEPPQLAVRQAIEMAVYSLVLEGCKSKLWGMSDPKKQLLVYDSYNHNYKEGTVSGSPPAPAALAASMPSKDESTKVVTLQRSDSVPSRRAEGEVPVEINRVTPSVKDASFAVSTSIPNQESEEKRPLYKATGRTPGWYIQVVPSAAKERDQLVTSLSSYGFPARPICTSGESSAACPVVVGPYATRQLAARIMSSIFSSHDAQAEVVFR